MADWMLDTNVLIFLANPSSLDHAPARREVSRLLLSGERCVLAVQTLYEFWSVVTRPVASNGLGWEVDRAKAAIEDLRGRFPVLPEPPEVFPIWLGIVSAGGITGKRVHDAHLAATMLANGVSRLVTFNPSDFASCGEIEIRVPAA